jgi:hypothetical protein
MKVLMSIEQVERFVHGGIGGYAVMKQILCVLEPTVQTNVDTPSAAKTKGDVVRAGFNAPHFVLEAAATTSATATAIGIPWRRSIVQPSSDPSSLFREIPICYGITTTRQVARVIGAARDDKIWQGFVLPLS